MAYVVCFVPGEGYQDTYLMMLPDGGRSYTSVRRWATRFSKATVDEALQLVRRDNPRYSAKAKRDNGRQSADAF